MLGAIGTIIAHEISHAFDSNGAKFGVTGELQNWWTKDDLAKFNDRCTRVKKYFDGISERPGIKNNGALTLGENLADLMGVKCCLDILSKTGSPDYRAFFIAYAKNFRMNATVQAEKQLSKTDVHSLGKTRVNRTLSNFAEFDKTFGIVKGDPMYVEPENRVSLW
jgi:putative endopeptidase